MKDEIVRASLYCEYCEKWQDVDRIKFSKEGIDVECNVCHSTTCYNIKQEVDGDA